uniref:Reverse transcriptase zinc-binding domain-containing protein n=1 Tax=Hordeum vulgare subsp. vulgare TaxID=112509 RepID=A0A8I6WG90_HORVV
MLPNWKSRLMNKAGRLALVKSVLSAIPIHQLLVLSPPKKTLKLIEKIERGFLWAGRAAANGGSCHVNWRRVCRPLSLGGLGIQDMERAGLALRLRWLWFSRTDERAWHGLDLHFSNEERALFFASTMLAVGDGRSGKFWEDRWLDGRSISELTPQLYACVPRHRRKQRTIADGLQNHAWARDIRGDLGIHEIGQYLLLWRTAQNVTLHDQPDQLIWRWTPSGTYSARSAYLAAFHGSVACDSSQLTWRSWTPPRVKFFLWLVSLDRCWTADRLRRHGLQHHPRCVFCDQEPETMRHLLVTCPFSRQVWHETLSWLRMTCRPPDHEATLNDWWLHAMRETPKAMRKGLATITHLTAWLLCKHRNSCVFDGEQPSMALLTARIREEAALWARAGAVGLGVVLPITWDVH